MGVGGSDRKSPEFGVLSGDRLSDVQGARPQILSLVLLYEIHTVYRFPGIGDFLSYVRLVTPKQTSGNVHLKWVFSEVVLGMLTIAKTPTPAISSA
jgi:hypothetical protein